MSQREKRLESHWKQAHAEDSSPLVTEVVGEAGRPHLR